MNKSLNYIILPLFAFSLVACGPSQAELDAQATSIAADIFASQTAAAPTATPTITPTPVPTSTPTETPRPTVTPYPLPDGWIDYSTSGFYIALPESWSVVELEEEGVEAIWQLMEGIESEWAQNITSLFSSELVAETIKFWAMSDEPAGAGYPNVNVSFQSQVIPIDTSELCDLLPSVYDQMGLMVVASECNLTINAIESARFVIRMEMGPLSIQQVQYLFVEGGRFWSVTLGVDETVWDAYVSLFDEIANTFRIDP